MSEKSDRTWEDFLNPDILRPRLIASSVFIAAFEILQDSITERLRSFYWSGFDKNGEHFDPSYDREVLSWNRSPIYASLAWLVERTAIEAADVEAYERIKILRNELAHELLGIVSTGLPAHFEDRFIEMVDLLRKIELWWVTEVEIPTNPNFDGKTVDPERIVPGPVMQLQLLCTIALAGNDESRFYHREFTKRRAAGDA